MPLILIVDDVDDNRDMYAEYFRFTGLRVDTAASAEEGLAKAFKAVPDVVIMDLALPGMDGWEATRRLKADLRTRQAKVLVLTGHALSEHELKARDAGAEAFVTKPCTPVQLLAKIVGLLSPAEGAKLDDATRRKSGRRRKSDA